MRFATGLAVAFLAACSSSPDGGTSGPSALTVAFTGGTCPNGVLTVTGTATGPQGAAFFIDDGVADLGSSACAPWYSIFGGCNRGDSTVDTITWTSSQPEQLTAPQTFTVTAKEIVNNIKTGVVQTKVTCGGPGGSGGGDAGSGSCTPALAHDTCCSNGGIKNCAPCGGPCQACTATTCPSGQTCSLDCSNTP